MVDSIAKFQVVVWVANAKEPIVGCTGSGFAFSTAGCEFEQTARDIYEGTPVNETITEVSLHAKREDGSWRELENRALYNGIVIRTEL